MCSGADQSGCWAEVVLRGWAMEGGNDPSSLESEAQKESQEFRANQGVSIGRELLSHRKRQNVPK